MTVGEVTLTLLMITRDGLIPNLPHEEHAWVGPTSSSSRSPDEMVEEVLHGIADIHLLNQIVWPARVDGQLVTPPDSHIVDSVIREHVIEAAGDDIRNEALLRPSPMTVAVLDPPLPSCSYCRSNRARYDTSVKAPGSGWALLCKDCYASHGIGTLGVGKGQYLLTWAELGEDICRAIDSATRYWEDRGIVAPAFSLWDR